MTNETFAHLEDLTSGPSKVRISEETEDDDAMDSME